jgi:hypothetical protein
VSGTTPIVIVFVVGVVVFFYIDSVSGDLRFFGFTIFITSDAADLVATNDCTNYGGSNCHCHNVP